MCDCLLNLKIIHQIINHTVFIFRKDAPITRNSLMQTLLDSGISSCRGIMVIHKEPAYIKDFGRDNLNMSKKLSDRSLLLPLYVPMDNKDLYKIISEAKIILS